MAADAGSDLDYDHTAMNRGDDDDGAICGAAAAMKARRRWLLISICESRLERG
jgi:hypothetical protein